MEPRLQLPSPVSQVSYHIFREYGVTVDVKREDEIHQLISGNKWRKLKYHLEYFRQSKHTHMITYGGAYSNHIFAFAHACRLFNIPGVVIIRGEEDLQNPTMKAVRNNNLDIHYVSRSDYRQKADAQNILGIIEQYPDPMVIPEGGSSNLAYEGIKELADEINEYHDIYNTIVLAAGTGCTAGYLIKALQPTRIRIEVFSALKGNFMKKEIEKWSSGYGRWNVIQDEEFGGYGKVNHQLIGFINDFYKESGIPLDPIYNGKVVYGLVQRTLSGVYPPGSSILWIHTGGLQGIAGFNQRWNGKYHINY